MILKLLITLIFVGTSVLKLTGKVARIGIAGATRGSSCMRPASPSFSRLPSSGGRDSKSSVPRALVSFCSARLQPWAGTVKDCPTLLSPL